MARPVIFVLAPLLIVAFAGCAGSDGGASSKEVVLASSVEASGGSIADAGSIEGTVTDDSLAPLERAIVAILDLDLRASTDATGAFSFTNLAPGTYKLAAVALGYESAGKSMTVVAGEVSTTSFTLSPIPVVEPYVQVLGPWAGFFDCRVGTPVLTGPCGVSTPNEKASFQFKMNNDTSAFVGEMRWTPGAFGTSKALRMSFSWSGRGSTHWFCSSTAASPVKWIYSMEDGCTGVGGNNVGGASTPAKPGTDITLLVYANTPFGSTSDPTQVVHVSLQQKFEIIVSMFHYTEADPLYTAFPDQ